MFTFSAELKIIGVNPFVFVPEEILFELKKLAGKEKGPIAVKGHVEGKAYTQTLVRFQGEWRLYINTGMLKDSPKQIGRTLAIEIEIDFESRILEAPDFLLKALDENPKAKEVFEGLIPSRKLEIVRYLLKLKQEESRVKNTARAINFLLGRERFIGRDKP